MATTPTDTFFDDSINLSELSTDKDAALEWVWLQDDSWRLYKINEQWDQTGRYAVTTTRPWSIEDFLLSNKHKVLDILDITEDPSNITEELVNHKRTNNTIDTYDFGGMPVHDTIQSAFADIAANTATNLGRANITFAVTPAPTTVWTEIIYEEPVGTVHRLSIHDFIIKAFHDKKIYNKAIGKYLFDREDKKWKQERADERRARMAARSGQSSSTGMPENPTNTPNNNVSAVNEELSIPQLYAACEQAQKKPNAWSAYSFDKKWFFVRYDNAVRQWIVQYQNDTSGGVTTTSRPTIGQIIADVTTWIKKKETQKPLDPIDMGNEFSESKFIDLCEAISKTSSKRGFYKLGGKEYIVTETTAAVAGGAPASYTAQYLGHVNRTVDHTAPGVALAHYLKEHIHFHEHPEWSHVFSKKGFKDLCEHIILAPNRRWEYELDGHKYPLWIETGSISDYIYHAEIPGEGWRTNEVIARSPEKLYEKILKKALRHNAEKPAESAAKAEWAEPKDAAHEGDHKANHPKTEGTFYDRSVEKVLGHGWIGRFAIGTKNLIPKPLRSLAGNTVGAGVTSGIVGWALYGGSLALGSVALSSAIVPAMTITFAASMANRLFKWRKWWPHNKQEDGGWHGWH